MTPSDGGMDFEIYTKDPEIMDEDTDMEELPRDTPGLPPEDPLETPPPLEKVPGLPPEEGLNDNLAGSEEVPNDILAGISKNLRERKATKSDDAPVPMSMWEEHLVEDGERVWNQKERKNLTKACDLLRRRMLKWWKKRVHSSFWTWLNKKYESEFEKIERINEQSKGGVRFENGRYVWTSGQTSKDAYTKWWKARMLTCPEDLEAGADANERAGLSSWWEWDDGSRPFHWRWKEEYQERIRDGVKVHFRTEPPCYTTPQRDVRDPATKEKVVEKLQKVRMRRYIAEGYVVSLTSFFEVPKGDDDIRMVYDGSIGGLNEAMWVPRFVLSTLNAHLRAVEEGTFIGDLDVGECFLNFMLHPSVRPYAGVDFTLFFPMATEGVALGEDGLPSLLQSVSVWEAWLRAAMGLKSSPYQSVQGLGFLRGRHSWGQKRPKEYLSLG
jgi:hypothetical protein